jgi:hypothetical protein
MSVYKPNPGKEPVPGGEAGDQVISDAVQQLRFSVPEHLDRKVDAALIDASQPRSFGLKVLNLFKVPRVWATAAACLLLIAALFWFQPDNGKIDTGEIPLKEIKTEIQLSNANIKILWVQKKDFKLIKEVK